MLSKDNTPSAVAFAEQRWRKADSLAGCRQSNEACRTGQGRIFAGTRKSRLIFSGGSAVCRLPASSGLQKMSLP